MRRSTIRRSIYLVLLGGGFAGRAVWVRRRDASGATGATPQWPPLTAVGDARSGATPAGSDDGDAETTSSFVNALVDAPDARSDASAGTWVPPLEDGSCPATHPIKANDNSGIYHVPGGRSYDRTKAERCYASEDAAAADGYRRAKL